MIRFWPVIKAKKSKHHPKEIWEEDVIESKWWLRLKGLYLKDTGKTIDRNDPEYSAQAIYRHWIKSYLG